MIELLALNPSWWQETFLIKVPIGLLAVLLPAGTIVYLYLFKAISSCKADLAHGSRSIWITSTPSRSR